MKRNYNFVESDKLILNEQIGNEIGKKYKLNEEDEKNIRFDKNILIIGSIGSGKSTFGNYILDNILFETDSSAESVTKNISHGVWKIKNYIINVYDTPGINESSDQIDIINLDKIIQLLNQIKFSCIFLCIPEGSRIDKQLEKTILYYKSIFLKYLDSIIIIITKSIQYNYMNILDKFLEEKLKLKFKMIPIDSLYPSILKKQKGELEELISNLYSHDGLTEMESVYLYSLERQYKYYTDRDILIDVIIDGDDKIFEVKFLKTAEILIIDKNILNTINGCVEGIELRITNHNEELRKIIIEKKIKKNE